MGGAVVVKWVLLFSVDMLKALVFKGVPWVLVALNPVYMKTFHTNGFHYFRSQLSFTPMNCPQGRLEQLLASFTNWHQSIYVVSANIIGSREIFVEA